MLQQAGFGQICSAATDYHATTANAVLLCSLSTAVFFFQMWPSNAVQNSSTRRQSRLLIRTVEIHWRHSVCIKDFAIIFHLFIHHNNKNSLVQRKQNCHVHKSHDKKSNKTISIVKKYILIWLFKSGVFPAFNLSYQINCLYTNSVTVSPCRSQFNRIGQKKNSKTVTDAGMSVKSICRIFGCPLNL